MFLFAQVSEIIWEFEGILRLAEFWYLLLFDVIFNFRLFIHLHVLNPQMIDSDKWKTIISCL